MISEDDPNIVNSVLEGIELFSGNWKLFFLDCGKFILLKFNKLMEGADLGLFVFEERHNKGF